MSDVTLVSRRKFLELTGVSAGGLLLSAAVPLSATTASVLSQAGGSALNLFVSVSPDGQVDIIAHRSEMGTGITTSLPQVVADEMGANWDRVRVIQGLANEAYGSQNTDGSRSIRDFYHVMRQTGAAARTLLEQAAAQTWGVAIEQCRAENHQVHNGSGEVLGFGELAEKAAQLPMPDLDSLKLKEPKDFNYIGRGVPIVDLQDMTTGNTVYGVDVHIPGMVYASIERTPVLGGKIKSFDAAAAKKVPGVLSVHKIQGKPEPALFNPLEGIAVVASNTWSAMRGREALSPQWHSSNHSSHSSTADLEVLVDKVSKELGDSSRMRGDVSAAFEKYSTVLDAVYKTPFLAHVSMEPPMATAHIHDGICEVWASTQAPQRTQSAVAEALGFSPEKVKIHVTLLGGGFGRKSKPDFCVEAALLARDVDKPVQVTWTREDDIRHDYYHSCSAQYYKAALDDKGSVMAWFARQAAPPITAIFELGANEMGDGALSQAFATIPFDIPNIKIERHKAEAHARIGWFRSVYNVFFAFGVGCFVDELANATSTDPMDFWLDLLGEDRHLDFSKENFELWNYDKPLADYPFDIGRYKHVMRELRQQCSWDEPLPDGQGWGTTAIYSFLSYVAVACKVEVKEGKLSVLEMHCVIDCGTVVNPDRVNAQMEGAMIFGLSLALMGEISFAEGVVEQSNFHDYPVARINQVPAIIRNHIIDSDALPTGVGEPGVPPVAPAIANAVFAATGKRIRELPLSKHFQI